MAIIAGRKIGRRIKQRTIRPIITAVTHSCKRTIQEGISVAKVPPSATIIIREKNGNSFIYLFYSI